MQNFEEEHELSIINSGNVGAFYLITPVLAL